MASSVTAPDTAAEAPLLAPTRFVSVDALRGFDMFWIIGADSLVEGMRKLNDAPWVQFLSTQLEHVAWEGCRFYDLIFPLFVFLVGTSSVFSLGRIVQTQGKPTAYARLFRRAVLLYLLGLFYYGGLSRDGSPETFRYVGVLQRIAFCYLCGGLVYLNFRWRGIAITAAILLLGYWALLTFVPVPGIGAGHVAEGQNLTNWIDQRYLPGYKWDGQWDPEGLLSHLPAVATALLGVLAGLLLQEPFISPSRRVAFLAAGGVAGIALGLLWGLQFPIIKKIWTSSYVLLAGGWSLLFLAAFHLVIDVWRLGLWARPFVWIGMNPITIYLLTHFVDFRSLVRRVLHRPLLGRISPYDDLTVSLSALALAVAVCYAMHRKRVFLRL